jgi:hypothetical protein|tara:strand:- start:6 stop:284 length:279 start_codon:yes stop_codon:yes gene_type:complete
MSEVCTVTMKLTDAEIDKIIWSMKSIKTVLSVFEIVPDKDWIITLDSILKDMEKIADNIKEAKDEKRLEDNKEPNPKKEYINKITGKESSEE